MPTVEKTELNIEGQQPVALILDGQELDRTWFDQEIERLTSGPNAYEQIRFIVLDSEEWVNPLLLIVAGNQIKHTEIYTQAQSYYNDAQVICAGYYNARRKTFYGNSSGLHIDRKLNMDDSDRFIQEQLAILLNGTGLTAVVGDLE